MVFLCPFADNLCTRLFIFGLLSASLTDKGGNAMKVNNNVQNEMLQTTQHPDYKTEIVEVLRSNFTPKIKQERILTYH